jgi:hypothetical protein
MACFSVRAAVFSNIQLRQFQGPLLDDIFSSSLIDYQRYKTIVYKLDGDFLGPFSHSMFEPVASFQKDKSAMCQLYFATTESISMFMYNGAFVYALREGGVVHRQPRKHP